MLAFAGLLVALAPQGQVGQNPPCFNGAYLLGDDTYRQCRVDEKPAPPTRDMLCNAATAGMPCCMVDYNAGALNSLCASDASVLNTLILGQGFTCSETITASGTDFYTLDCTGYEGPSNQPAEPAEDLDGATVGTIVVASLIGVALVGGAVAVHLQV